MRIPVNSGLAAFWGLGTWIQMSWDLVFTDLFLFGIQDGMRLVTRISCCCAFSDMMGYTLKLRCKINSSSLSFLSHFQNRNKTTSHRYRQMSGVLNFSFILNHHYHNLHIILLWYRHGTFYLLQLFCRLVKNTGSKHLIQPHIAFNHWIGNDLMSNSQISLLWVKGKFQCWWTLKWKKMWRKFLFILKIFWLKF